MSEAITKLQRWLDLIVYLSGRRLPVSVEELMERIPAYARKWETGEATAQATARRTFERDKDELRRFGIPIRTVTYSINYGGEKQEGYRLDRRDFYLPYLRLVSRLSADSGRRAAGRFAEVELREEEGRLALDALRRAAELPSFPLAAEARSALRKLAFDLDPALWQREPPMLFVDRPEAGELRERLRVLSDALLTRKRVRFRYHGLQRGAETERNVAPYGLLYQNGHWYLVGHDALRDAIRVFRVGRMEEVVQDGRGTAAADYAIPADFRLDAFTGLQPWELGDRDEPPLRVDVLFHFPLSLWAARNGYGRAVERRENGQAVRTFDVYQTPPFLRWLLSLEGDAEVIDPPELNEELRNLAVGVAELHETGDRDG